MVTLQNLKEIKPDWFSTENMRFFGDLSYDVLYGEATEKPYLIRKTNAWTDMFGGKPLTHYCINRIKDDLTIGELVYGSGHCAVRFKDMDEVEDWLEEN